LQRSGADIASRFKQPSVATNALRRTPELKPDMPLALIPANTQHEIVTQARQIRGGVPAEAACRAAPVHSCQVPNDG